MSHNPEANRNATIEEAIRSFDRALEGLTQEQTPLEWAEVHLNRGCAFMERLSGERIKNIEEAIHGFNNALQVYAREKYPAEWATAQMNRAIAYAQRLQDDRSKNQEEAIEIFEMLQDFYDRKTEAKKWADVQLNRANAYRERLLGERLENLEKSIQACEWALEVHTRENAPVDWAMIHGNRANGYLQRIQGARAQNIEEAIRSNELALSVFNRQSTPFQWAMAQMNQATAYMLRIHGEREENLKKAIQDFDLVLQDFLHQAAPFQWAETQTNRALAYMWRKGGDPIQNHDEAVHSYDQALTIFTRETAPFQWAMAHMNRAIVFRHRSESEKYSNEDRVRYQEEALKGCNNALLVCTRYNAPYEWALANLNRANISSNRIKGYPTGNQEEAIRSYKNALEVFTPQTAPDDARKSAHALGNLLFGLARWEEAADAYGTAIQAIEIQYGVSLLPTGKEHQLELAGDLFARAGYAMAKCGTKRLREAALIFDLGRARWLGESLQRDRADLEHVRTVSPELYAQYKKAASQLSDLETKERIAAPEQRAPGSVDSFSQAQQAHETLQEAIGQIRQIEGFEHFLIRPGFEDVARVVEVSQPIVYLTTTDVGSLALVLGRKSTEEEVRVEPVWANSFNRETLVSILFKEGSAQDGAGLLIGQEGDVEEYKRTIDEALSILGERLVALLAERLRQHSSQSVRLISLGLLGLLPLHAASYKAGGEYLCLLDEFEVIYSPSASVLAACRMEQTKRQRASYSFAAIGDPWPVNERLPHARAEVASLMNLLSYVENDSHWARYDKEATLEALWEKLPHATHLHLACHGVFNADHPLESAFQLGQNTSLSLRTLLEADAERLSKLRLAFLSACQTGLADYRKLPDEVVGLPAGFLQAGVPTVIGTLWPAHDLSTALLVIRFYEVYLNGEEQAGVPPGHASSALRLAQRWLRDLTYAGLGKYLGLYGQKGGTGRNSMSSKLYDHLEKKVFWVYRSKEDDKKGRKREDEKPFKEPYYWAPFACYGAG